LKAILPTLFEVIEHHVHLNLDPEIQNLILAASAATIDRLLAPVLNQAKSRKKKRRSPKANKKIPVRTFSDWNEPNPEYLIIDFVVR